MMGRSGAAVEIKYKSVMGGIGAAVEIKYKNSETMK